MDRQSAKDMVKGALVVLFALLCAYLVDDYRTTRAQTFRIAQAVRCLRDAHS